MSLLQISFPKLNRAIKCFSSIKQYPFPTLSRLAVPGTESYSWVPLMKTNFYSTDSSSSGSRNGCEDKISNTSVFVQDGLHIEELPCIVRVVQGEFLVHDSTKTRKGKKLLGTGIESVSPPYEKVDISSAEEEEMVNGFSRCSSLTELYYLLCQCPEDEVTPPVAFSIIKKLILLENNKHFRNPVTSHIQEEEEEAPISDLLKGTVNPVPENFTRAAVMERLVDKICKGPQTDLVLDTVKVLGKDTSNCDKSAYIKRLCDKCLLLVSEGKLSVSQIAALCRDLHYLNNDIAKPYSDKLWTGLEEHIDELNEVELTELFGMIPFLNQSRKYVYHLAERRALTIWYKFKPDDILKIVCILATYPCNSYKLLGAISRWMNLHIHTLTEHHLRWMMCAFKTLHFTNDHLQRSITRYARAKKSLVKDPALIASVLDFCSAMRFRSPEVMEMGAKFFTENYTSINVPDIYQICSAFGTLNYVPTDNYTFFKHFEEVLNAHFVAFSPDVLVDLLLTCVYLERYPLNFIEKVYHPFFFQRLEMLNANDVKLTRSKLRVLDKALSLEASCYKRRMIAKNFSSRNWMTRDVRIGKCVHQIRHVIEEIAGSANRVHLSVSPPGFPFMNFYKVDCLVDLTVRLDVFDSLLPEDCNERFALLVHPGEHYDLSRTHLLGHHAMRARHFAVAGYRVVNLEYERIQANILHPEVLKDYLLESILSAIK